MGKVCILPYMATSATQSTLATFGVHEYELGDLLESRGLGRSTRKRLVECPLCATDPKRRRYHFAEQESRPRHFREQHDAGDLLDTPIQRVGRDGEQP